MKLKLRALVCALGFLPAVAHAVEEPGVTTGRVVVVYKGPSERAPRVTQIRNNHEVMVDRYRDGWVHIRFRLEFAGEIVIMDGWVQEKFVRSKSRHGFFFQREGDEPEEDGPEEAQETQETGIFAHAGPAVVMSSLAVSAPGVSESASQQSVGAHVAGTYWANEHVGTRLRAIVGDGAVDGNITGSTRSPMGRSATLRSRVSIVAADVVYRRPLGPLVLLGSGGVESIDYQVAAVGDAIVPHRYTGATAGAGAALHAGKRVHLTAMARYWLAPVASEANRDPFTKAGPSGFVDSAVGFGGEARLDVRVAERWKLSVDARYVQVTTTFRGDGRRFGRAVTDAETSESFLAAGLMFAYAL